MPGSSSARVADRACSFVSCCISTVSWMVVLVDARPVGGQCRCMQSHADSDGPGTLERPVPRGRHRLMTNLCVCPAPAGIGDIFSLEAILPRIELQHSAVSISRQQINTA